MSFRIQWSLRLGVNHRDSKFIHVVVVMSKEVGANLSLRASVNVDDDRVFARKLRRWFVHECRDGVVVKDFQWINCGSENLEVLRPPAR